MLTNREMLNWLFQKNIINLKPGKIFNQNPSRLPDKFNFERIEGMMLGLAIGDALGVTSESKVPSLRKKMYGEIRNYLPNKYTGKKLGYPSDDTQLAFWTLEQMLMDKGFVPDHVATKFCHNKIFGIGKTVREFIHNYKDSKQPWYLSGPKSSGNGAMMRIAPMIIPHLRTGTSDLWVDTALSAMITHNDSTSTSACISFINMLWELLKMESAPKPKWWIETYVKIAKDLEIDDGKTPRGGNFQDYQGPLWKYVKKYVSDAYKQNLSVLEACETWQSGAFLYETLPSCIYILMKHSDDPEEAIVRAINDTKDNDSIAAIVSTAVGALHGKKGLPKRWLNDLTGRTTLNDDGQVFKLLERAKNNWS